MRRQTMAWTKDHSVKTCRSIFECGMIILTDAGSNLVNIILLIAKASLLKLLKQSSLDFEKHLRQHAVYTRNNAMSSTAGFICIFEKSSTRVPKML